MDPFLLIVIALIVVILIVSIAKAHKRQPITIGVVATMTGWALLIASLILGLIVAVQLGSPLVIAFVLLAIFVVIGYFIGKAAERKGRSFSAFFLLSIIASPVIMGIIVAALPPVRSTAPRSSVPSITGGSIAEELTNLAALRAQGVLTDAEFEAAKAAVLNG